MLGLGYILQLQAPGMQPPQFIPSLDSMRSEDPGWLRPPGSALGAAQVRRCLLCHGGVEAQL